MKRLNILYFLVVVIFTSPSYVNGQVFEEVVKKAAEATFSAAERELIKKYYEATGQAEDSETAENENRGNRSKGNSRNNKGMGNRPDLPRGIAKKLERGGTLPPGIAKRPLAGDLERQLPKVPDGYERVESDGKVILRNVVTGVISDMIDVVAKSGNNPAVDQDIKTDRTPEDYSEDTPAEKKWWQFWK